MGDVYRLYFHKGNGSTCQEVVGKSMSIILGPLKLGDLDSAKPRKPSNQLLSSCARVAGKSSILSPSLVIPFLSLLVAPIQPPFVGMAPAHHTGGSPSIGHHCTACGSCRLQSPPLGCCKQEEDSRNPECSKCWGLSSLFLYTASSSYS